MKIPIAVTSYVGLSIAIFLGQHSVVVALDIIMATRQALVLASVKDKVYTRDLFGSD